MEAEVTKAEKERCALGNQPGALSVREGMVSDRAGQTGKRQAM